ncbi:unnamed protein product, partial [Closterium sp. NIES-54]
LCQSLWEDASSLSNSTAAQHPWCAQQTAAAVECNRTAPQPSARLALPSVPHAAN